MKTSIQDLLSDGDSSGAFESLKKVMDGHPEGRVCRVVHLSSSLISPMWSGIVP